MLIHDDTVDRTTDGTGEVRDMTFATLRQLDAGYGFTTDDGATYPHPANAQIAGGVSMPRELGDEKRASLSRPMRRSSPASVPVASALAKASLM